jgi:zinc protease
MARSAAPPFIAAASGKEDENRSADITMIDVTAEPSRWGEALSAVEKEQRRAAQFGVRQDELDREIVEVRARLTAAAKGAATRRPAELADEIVGTLTESDVVTSPADDLRLFEEIVKDLSAAEVSGALKRNFSGSGPLLFAASPKPLAGGEATLRAALESSRKVAVKPPPAPRQVSWPYATFGPPGRVTERRSAADLGVTFVRFANGVRLTVKPTKFRDDEVLVRVNIGRGLLELPGDQQAATWAAGAFIEGGLKAMSTEDMDRVLADKLYGARFGAADDAFVLSGGTRTADLPTQLQVLAAYASAPGWRREAFQRIQASGSTIHDQYEATDFGVLGRDLAGLMRAGDRRWTFPSREEIARARLEDLERQVGPALAKGPIEVVVVGDVDLEAVISQTAATFGALPPRLDLTPLAEAKRKLGFPAANAQPLVLTHKGRADQAIAYMAWPTEDMWADPKRAWATDLLGEVLRNRLTEQIRETEGATYSPSVSYGHSLVWTGWGYMSASVEVPPNRLQGFFDDARQITADLRARPVSEDELARAKQPRVQGLQRAQVTNQYWLAELSRAQADPRRLDLIRQIVPGTAAVTPEDLRQAAQMFLQDDTAFRLVVRPQPR